MQTVTKVSRPLASQLVSTSTGVAELQASVRCMPLLHSVCQIQQLEFIVSVLVTNHIMYSFSGCYGHGYLLPPLCCKELVLSKSTLPLFVASSFRAGSYCN